MSSENANKKKAEINIMRGMAKRLHHPREAAPGQKTAKHRENKDHRKPCNIRLAVMMQYQTRQHGDRYHEYALETVSPAEITPPFFNRNIIGHQALPGRHRKSPKRRK